jgi:hypothetical protein
MDKLSSEVHQVQRRCRPENLSPKEKENRHAQDKRLYANRASGSYCHHCAVDGDTAAHTATRQKSGESRSLSVKPEAMGHSLGNVCE